MLARIRAIAVVIMIIAVAPAAFGAFWFEYTYYDSTWTTVVGQVVDDNCEGDDSSWGTTSDYRTRASVNCDTGGHAFFCQQFINGQWVTISCPF